MKITVKEKVNLSFDITAKAKYDTIFYWYFNGLWAKHTTDGCQTRINSRCNWVYLARPSGKGMYKSDRRQFLFASVLPTDSGVALSQTRDKRHGWLKTVPVVWHFPMSLFITPGDWSRSSSASQHGGERGVENAGAVCRGTVHYGQGYEGVAAG